MRDERLPVRAIGRRDGRSHDLVIASVFVGTDVEQVAAVFHVILLFVDARRNDLELTRGFVRRQVADLRSRMAAQFHEQELVTA